jgi:hypothetical protein
MLGCLRGESGYYFAATVRDHRDAGSRVAVLVKTYLFPGIQYTA